MPLIRSMCNKFFTLASIPNTSTLNRAKFPIKITNNSSNLSKIKIDSSQLICIFMIIQVI